MIPFAALLANRWTLRLGAGVLAVTLVLGYGLYQRRKGRTEGKQQADVTWSDTLEKMRVQDRLELDRRLADADARISEAETRFQASLAREASLIAQVRALASQRQEAIAQVGRLPDSALHGYVVSALGLRPAGDSTPGYTVSEERALAKCVADYPLCQQQNDMLAKQVNEVRGQVAELQVKTEALVSKNDALAAYTSKLEAYYVAVYNSLPRKKRGAKCLWLWQCGKPKPLQVPAPLDLHKP